MFVGECRLVVENVCLMVQVFKKLSEDCSNERFDICFTLFFCLDQSLLWFELGNGGRWSLALLIFRGLGGCSLVLLRNQVDDVRW